VGWNLPNQLAEFISPHASQGTHVNMPERFSFPNQPRPGAYLLPLAQARANRSLMWMQESRHGSSLMRSATLSAKPPRRFGVLKQMRRLRR